MNLAFPAALLFAFLLPGFLLRTAFQQPEGNLPDTTPFARAITASALLALVLNALACLLMVRFTSWRVDWPALLLLVSADRGAAYEQAAARVAVYPEGPLLYLLAVSAAAWLTGTLARGLIRLFRQDRDDMPLSVWLRADTPWYYLFSGYDSAPPPDAVLVCAVVEIGREAWLYVGRLKDYILTRDGQISRLVLEDVSRRPIEADKIDLPVSQAGTQQERFYPVDGDYFVLRADEIRTLNIRYVRLRMADALSS